MGLCLSPKELVQNETNVFVQPIPFPIITYIKHASVKYLLFTLNCHMTLYHMNKLEKKKEKLRTYWHTEEDCNIYIYIYIERERFYPYLVIIF